MPLTILHPSLLPPHPAHWNLRLAIDTTGNYSIINTPHTHYFSLSGQFETDTSPDVMLTNRIDYLFDRFREYVLTNPTPSFLPPPPPPPTVNERLDNHEARITTLESNPPSNPQNTNQGEEEVKSPLQDKGFDASTPSSPYKLYTLKDFDRGGVYNIPNDPQIPHDPDDHFSFEVSVSSTTVSLYFHSIPDAARNRPGSLYPSFRSINGTHIQSYSRPEIGRAENIFLPGSARQRDHEIATLTYKTPEEAQANASRIFFALCEYASHLYKKALRSSTPTISELQARIEALTKAKTELEGKLKSAEASTQISQESFRLYLEGIYRLAFQTGDAPLSWSSPELVARIKTKIAAYQQIMRRLKDITST
jgi:hypothetical protein